MAAHGSNYEPLSRWGQAAAAVGSKLYMWRGWNGFIKTLEEDAPNIDRFDVTTELWEQKSIYKWAGLPSFTTNVELVLAHPSKQGPRTMKYKRCTIGCCGDERYKR